MSNLTLQQNAISQLAVQADAIGKLAEDTGAFAATFAAFESNDPDAFRWVLQRLELLPRCELICEWIRVKLCGLRCVEVCGPLDPKVVLPELPEFARALSQLASNEAVLRRVVDAVSCGDADSYQAAIAEVKLQSFCHLICRYVCSLHYRRICEVVCSGLLVPVSDPVLDIRADAEILSKVFANEKLTSVIGKAVIALDCEALSTELSAAMFLPYCEIICRVSCVWRSVWVCRALCLEPPVIFRGTYAVEEARNFALAARQLAGQPRALSDLAAAVISNNAQGFSAIVDRYRLSPYCWQVCGWVSSQVCYEFCICVCPPPEVIPLFTKVGEYRVDPIWNDFTADGTTAAGDYAFTSEIPLIGIIPNGDAPTAIQYRFQTEKYPMGGGPVPVTPAMIPPTIIGQLEYWQYVGGSWAPGSANYWANNPDPMTNTISIPQLGGPPLVVPVNKTVAPDGWIDVPRENQLFQGGVGRFIGGANNVFANLDTTKLTNEVFDLTAAVPPLPVLAGDPVPGAQQSERPHFKIYFEARNAMTLAAVSSNNRDKIALSNTTYTYIRHPDWAGGPVTGTPVVSLDVVELKAGGGCNPLAGHIHVLFTAYHPYLATCVVYIQGPGVPPPPPVNPPISPIGQAISPAGGQDFNISTLKPCAYVLWISTTLNLTQGYGKLTGEFDDLIAFCIH